MVIIIFGKESQGDRSKNVDQNGKDKKRNRMSGKKSPPQVEGLMLL